MNPLSFLWVASDPSFEITPASPFGNGIKDALARKDGLWLCIRWLEALYALVRDRPVVDWLKLHGSLQA